MLCLHKMLENHCSYICFLGSLRLHLWKTVIFLFHKYSYVKTDAWVYLEYLVESVIWEIAFPQQTRDIDVKKKQEHSSKSSYSCPDTELCCRSNSPLTWDTANSTQTSKIKLIEYLAFFHLVVCYKKVGVVDKSDFWHCTTGPCHVRNLMAIRPVLTAQHLCFPQSMDLHWEKE